MIITKPILAFQATGEVWRLHYDQTHSPDIVIRPSLTTTGFRVAFSGNCNNRHLLQKAMVEWLKGVGKRHLIPQMRALSQQLALPINRVTVRHQKTRWGSCSCKRNINLNTNLLFLNPDFVRYVMVHELCHTVHMNHSSAFWALVEQFEPNYRRLDKAINQTQDLIPAWAAH